METNRKGDRKKRFLDVAPFIWGDKKNGKDNTALVKILRELYYIISSDVQRLFELKKKYRNIIRPQDADGKKLREVAERLERECHEDEE